MVKIFLNGLIFINTIMLKTWQWFLVILDNESIIVPGAVQLPWNSSVSDESETSHSVVFDSL